MSRSNPNENRSPNPAVRWFEWNGEQGAVRYYDKEAKKNVDVGSDFTFLLLDKLASVRGWHDASNSGIYSNEVKDTTQEVLVVKSFKGGPLAEGFYRDIKDKVNSLGGQFVSTLYIAFKRDGELVIGALRLKGAALGAWMEFEKAHKAHLYDHAIRVKGFTEGKKGRIVYRTPILHSIPSTPDTNFIALALDKELQTYFDGYFKRPRKEQAETQAVADEPDGFPANELPETADEDQVPF
jgi:hypothetical protein